MTADDGLDDSKLTLSAHLEELRGRLIKSLLAVVITGGVCLAIAPGILDYAVGPLTRVLQEKNRVEAVLVHADPERRTALAARLEAHARAELRASLDSLSGVVDVVRAGVDTKQPIDLLLISSEVLRGDGALVSDLLEGVDPAPHVVYLVQDPEDPAARALQLEGISVLLEPLRKATFERLIRRSLALAGKIASGDKLVVLSPLEPFFAYLKIALVCGLFLACPIWLYQAWRFVVPGLYLKERRVLLPVVFSSAALFVGGGLFAYYVMFPVMFDFLVKEMMPSSVAGSFTVDNYLGLLLRLTIAFGVVFELPLALALLSSVGVVTPELLKRWRKYAIVVAFVGGAFLTPADPLSQMMMAGPLIVFYELGIILATLLGRREVELEEAGHEVLD